jgi:hypothetical protein
MAGWGTGRPGRAGEFRTETVIMAWLLWEQQDVMITVR